MYPRSSSPAKPTTMFRPSARNVYRMAKLAMRTHAVPTEASANGNAISAIAIRATPTHFDRALANVVTAPTARGVRCVASWRSSPVPDAFAEEPGRTQHENADQHQESKHVLVIAAENIIGQAADIACTQCFDYAEQNAAQHRAGKVADAAEHGRRECFHAQKRTHGVVRNA